MALMEKYRELLELSGKLSIPDLQVEETGGKIQIKGTTDYQSEKDQLWDKIKSYSGWENEIAADIKVSKNEIYGYYTVKAGDSLSAIAKGHLGSANRYTEIFELNKDVLKNPDVIHPGQKLKLPAKAK